MSFPNINGLVELVTKLAEGVQASAHVAGGRGPARRVGDDRELVRGVGLQRRHVGLAPGRAAPRHALPATRHTRHTHVTHTSRSRHARACANTERLDLPTLRTFRHYLRSLSSSTGFA